MKRCPKCRRDYHDDSLSYCLDDGAVLVDGPLTSDEPETAILTDRKQIGLELKTPQQLDERNISEGRSRSGRSIWKWTIAAALVAIVGVTSTLTYRNWNPGSKQLESIAVMPFVNDSGSPDVEYLSDGMTETLIESLSELPNLNVKPRSSVFRYKGKDTDHRTLGKELNVQAILNGRVVTHGNEVALYVELIDTDKDTVIWSTNYDRSVTNLISLQREIASDVLSKLRLKLTGTDEAKIEKTHTENPAAYQLYLKGDYQTSTLTRDGFQKGLQYFDQAIALDPNYARAYNGIAYNYVNAADWFVAPTEASVKAKEAATKALSLDESLPGAHLSLAVIAFWFDWNRPVSEREFQRAIELSPNDPTPHEFYSLLMVSVGRTDEAIAEAKRAQLLDPVSPETNFTLGSVYFSARQYEQAADNIRRAVELDETFWYSHDFLGRVYEQQGKLPQAIAEFQRALELDDSNPENWSNIGHAWAIADKKREAQNAIDHLNEMSASRYVAPYNYAAIYAGLGEKDKAFEWLEHAYNSRSLYLALLLTTDPHMDSLRSDPRMADLIHRIGL